MIVDSIEDFTITAPLAAFVSIIFVYVGITGSGDPFVTLILLMDLALIFY
jgi:hypothetical protein